MESNLYCDENDVLEDEVHIVPQHSVVPLSPLFTTTAMRTPIGKDCNHWQANSNVSSPQPSYASCTTSLQEMDVFFGAGDSKSCKMNKGSVLFRDEVLRHRSANSDDHIARLRRWKNEHGTRFYECVDSGAAAYGLTELDLNDATALLRLAEKMEAWVSDYDATSVDPILISAEKPMPPEGSSSIRLCKLTSPEDLSAMDQIRPMDVCFGSFHSFVAKHSGSAAFRRAAALRSASASSQQAYIDFINEWKQRHNARFYKVDSEDDASELNMEDASVLQLLADRMYQSFQTRKRKTTDTCDAPKRQRPLSALSLEPQQEGREESLHCQPRSLTTAHVRDSDVCFGQHQSFILKHKGSMAFRMEVLRSNPTNSQQGHACLVQQWKNLYNTKFYQVSSAVDVAELDVEDPNVLFLIMQQMQKYIERYNSIKVNQGQRLEEAKTLLYMAGSPRPVMGARMGILPNDIPGASNDSQHARSLQDQGLLSGLSFDTGISQSPEAVVQHMKGLLKNAMAERDAALERVTTFQHEFMQSLEEKHKLQRLLQITTAERDAAAQGDAMSVLKNKLEHVMAAHTSLNASYEKALADIKALESTASRLRKENRELEDQVIALQLDKQRLRTKLEQAEDSLRAHCDCSDVTPERSIDLA
jgi:hypothetical protein